MVVVAAVGLGITAVGAQDAASPRRDIMRANGKALFSDISKMVKGETPYSQASVDVALTQLEDSLKKVPAAWAQGSSRAPEGGNFKTSDKVWDNLSDFHAKAAATAKAAADARATVKDLATLKAAASAIGNGCNSCHEAYRQRI
jgi:cytochrome c556